MTVLVSGRNLGTETPRRRRPWEPGGRGQGTPGITSRPPRARESRQLTLLLNRPAWLAAGCWTGSRDGQGVPSWYCSCCREVLLRQPSTTRTHTAKMQNRDANPARGRGRTSELTHDCAVLGGGGWGAGQKTLHKRECQLN